jgi:hypothetical protein
MKLQHQHTTLRTLSRLTTPSRRNILLRIITPRLPRLTILIPVTTLRMPSRITTPKLPLITLLPAITDKLIKAGGSVESVLPRENENLFRLPFLRQWLQTSQAIVIHFAFGMLPVNHIRKCEQACAWRRVRVERTPTCRDSSCILLYWNYPA